MKMRLIFAAAAAAFSFMGVAMAQDESATLDAAASEAEAAPADEPAEATDYFARDKLEIRTIVCPFKGQIKYKPGEVSCGLLAVPENREKTRSRTIELMFVKLHARKPEKWDDKEKGEWKKRDDAIIYLTGGPGAKAAGYVKKFKDHGARDVRDMYILEQRGIGNSADFCPKYGLGDPAPGNTSDWEAYQRAGLIAVEGCFQQAKAARVDLSGYNTIENARDVEALRRALGIAQWNVWGISYGSILGQAYIKQDPAGIRAVILDAIVPIVPGAHFQRIANHYQRDLDLLEKACMEDKTCKQAFPDFQARLKSAIVKAQGEPITIENAIDTELFPSGSAWFFGDLVGGLPFSLMYEQKNYPTLPALIDAFTRKVEKGDGKSFRILTAGGAGGPAGFEISQGMYNAIACNDGWANVIEEAVTEDAREHPELAALLGDPALFGELAAVCKRYGMEARPAEQYAAVVTDIPAIIADGQMDPITPPPLAKMIVPGFSRGTYVEFPNSGHGPTRSVDCAGDFVTKFFDAPTAKVDTTCPDSIKPLKFTGRLMKADGLANLAAAAAEDPKKLAAPILWASVSALILFVGFVVYFIAPAARLVNRDAAMSTRGARPLAFATALLGAASIAGLAAAIAMTFKANEALMLGGLLGWARWFAAAGLLGGLTGLGALFLGVKARLQEALPVGVLSGLMLTGAAGVAYALFLIVNGLMPF